MNKKKRDVMLLHLSDFSETPLHRQIADQLLLRMLSDQRGEEFVLQSTRSLARTQRVSVRTVERAYGDLAALGLLEALGDAEYKVKTLTLEEKERLAEQLQAQAEGHPPEKALPALDEALARELAIAQNFQATYLPKCLPSDKCVSLAASYAALGSVGGDLYDYVPIDERRFGLMIADACGKGLPGALLISQIQAIFKAMLSRGFNITRVLDTVNQQLVRFTPKDKFATLFYGIFDKATNQFEYASAGHNSPIWIKQDGTAHFLAQGAPALGLSAASTYQTERVQLSAGDLIFIYTDGVTEAMNGVREEYGEERLLTLLKQARRLSPPAVVDAVVADLQKFRAGALQQDDETTLVLKVNL